MACRLSVGLCWAASGCRDIRRMSSTLGDYGKYWVNAEDGYRGTGVPAITDFCVDWHNIRGRFKFNGQARRCFKKIDKGEYYQCGRGPPDHQCWRDVWPEVPCMW